MTNETLTRAGVTNINDAIRAVSADGAGSISTGFQGGFSAGGAAVSLRGLGVSSTLVLIDGLRSTNFPLNDDGRNSYVDLNSIPFSAVERVEVLKDGASATYGADAIGGVVNVILKKHVQGVLGTVEGGASSKGDAGRYRANLTAGVGDYDSTGWNFYVNGEYQRDNRVSGQDRGFPYDTNDLSSIGGLDRNGQDSNLASATVNAVVRRTTQTNLNDPFAGGVAATGRYTTLNLTNCANGTYTVAGEEGGIGCRHDNAFEFSQIQPKQERYAFSGRLSVRLSPNIEGYVAGSYSHSGVSIRGTPPSAQQTLYSTDAAPASSQNPGIVLPVYVCAAGVNCLVAADRRVNPNNPYAAAAAAANDPVGGAARLYYLFGDIPSGSDRTNEVIRGTAGLRGSFGDDWNWRVDAVGAKDSFSNTSYGIININGLRQAINTGAYNFVNPELNSQAVRQLVAPTFTAKAKSSLASLDASITKSIVELAGGSLQLAVGGQIRRETLNNPGVNPNRDRFANTAAAFGKRTVSAAYFEVNAPVLAELEINAAGRYDHYSEGYGRFSPKIGAKFTPIKEVALRGTYSQGFRAPTFAESGERSTFTGFIDITPPPSFQLAHGGLVSNGNTNPYAQAYRSGSSYIGNPDLKPEKSRSFTGGVVLAPTRWLSLTADYYNVKKTDVIVAGPLISAARDAYFAGGALPAGYTVAVVDAPDPLFPNALPRVLAINAPFVNAASQKTSGLDFGMNASIRLAESVRFISRADVNTVLKFNEDNGNGIIRKYVGTMGPYELSSGAGTPRWRGNWQNTIELGAFSFSATAYYVSRIKQVAADSTVPEADGSIDLSCENANLYGTGDKFCYIRRFIYADLNAAVRVNEAVAFNFYVGNFTNAKAPIAPASYSGVNYLPTWHYAGVIGRTFRAGASFKF